jgi:hypothetical protein
VKVVLNNIFLFAQATEDRIISFYERSDDNILLKMGSLGGLQNTTNRSLLEIQHLEKDALLQCGVSVASSAIMMLDLIRTCLDISKTNIGTVGMNDVKEDAMHIQCALQYSQIEVLGIGCTRWLTEASKADKTARLTAKALMDSSQYLLQL